MIIRVSKGNAAELKPATLARRKKRGFSKGLHGLDAAETGGGWADTAAKIAQAGIMAIGNDRLQKRNYELAKQDKNQLDPATNQLQMRVEVAPKVGMSGDTKMMIGWGLIGLTLLGLVYTMHRNR